MVLNLEIFLPLPCFTALLIPVFFLLQGGILAAVSGTSDGSSLTAVSYKLVLITWERCDWLQHPRKAGLWKEVFLWYWWFGLVMNKVYFYSVNVPQSFHLRHHDLWPAPLTLIVKDCIQTMDRGRSCTSCLPVKSFKSCNKAKTFLSPTCCLDSSLLVSLSRLLCLHPQREGLGRGERRWGKETHLYQVRRRTLEESEVNLHVSSSWFTFMDSEGLVVGLGLVGPGLCVRRSSWAWKKGAETESHLILINIPLKVYLWCDCM